MICIVRTCSVMVMMSYVKLHVLFSEFINYLWQLNWCIWFNFHYSTILQKNSCYMAGFMETWSNLFFFKHFVDKLDLLDFLLLEISKESNAVLFHNYRNKCKFLYLLQYHKHDFMHRPWVFYFWDFPCTTWLEHPFEFELNFMESNVHKLFLVSNNHEKIPFIWWI